MSRYLFVRWAPIVCGFHTRSRRFLASHRFTKFEGQNALRSALLAFIVNALRRRSLLASQLVTRTLLQMYPMQDELLEGCRR